MTLRRLSLVLVAAFFLTPDAWGVRSSRSPLDSTADRQARNMGRAAVVTLSGPRTSCISPVSTWRYRLKSVLQESENRFICEADLGPVPMPEPSFSSEARTPRFDPFRTIVPLRC